MQVMYATKHSQGYVIVLQKIDFDYININEGGSLRLDCPMCLNRKTLLSKGTYSGLPCQIIFSSTGSFSGKPYGVFEKSS